MAALEGTLVTGEVTTGVAAKTILQLVAAANHRVKINALSVSFKGVATADAPIKCRLVRQSTAGTMTALTPSKGNPNDDETLQTTGQHTATVEPTEVANSIVWSHEIHPQTGYREQFARPKIVQGGGRIGLEVTASVSTTVIVGIDFEE